MLVDYFDASAQVVFIISNSMRLKAKSMSTEWQHKTLKDREEIATRLFINAPSSSLVCRFKIRAQIMYFKNVTVHSININLIPFQYLLKNEVFPYKCRHNTQIFIIFLVVVADIETKVNIN